MSFVEVRFPDDIAYGSSGGPAYSTDVVVTESGHEKRNINWQVARARYEVAHGVKTQQQLDDLIAFFRARKGRAYGFRFKDWMDYQGIGEIIGVGDDVATSFQLTKKYISGGSEEVRTIKKPVSSSVSIYFDSILQSSGFTIDYSSGIIDFSVAPTAGTVIASDFEFDVPVRFDSDNLYATIESYGVRSWNSIPLIELRS